MPYGATVTYFVVCYSPLGELLTLVSGLIQTMLDLTSFTSYVLHVLYSPAMF